MLPGAPPISLHVISDETAPPLMSNFLISQWVFSCAAKNCAPGFSASSSVMQDLDFVILPFMPSMMPAGTLSGSPSISTSTISMVFSHSPGSRRTWFISSATSSAVILPSPSRSAPLSEQPAIKPSTATDTSNFFTNISLNFDASRSALSRCAPDVNFLARLFPEDNILGMTLDPFCSISVL